MIKSDPEAFWATMSQRETHKNVVWSEEDLKVYKSSFFKLETLHSVGPSFFYFSSPRVLFWSALAR